MKALSTLILSAGLAAAQFSQTPYYQNTTTSQVVSSKAPYANTTSNGDSQGALPATSSPVAGADSSNGGAQQTTYVYTDATTTYTVTAVETQTADSGAGSNNQQNGAGAKETTYTYEDATTTTTITAYQTQTLSANSVQTQDPGNAGNGGSNDDSQCPTNACTTYTTTVVEMHTKYFVNGQEVPAAGVTSVNTPYPNVTTSASPQSNLSTSAYPRPNVTSTGLLSSNGTSILTSVPVSATS